MTRKDKLPRQGAKMRLRPLCRACSSETKSTATVATVDPNTRTFRIDGLDGEVFAPDPNKRNWWKSHHFRAVPESKTGKVADWIVDVITDI